MQKSPPQFATVAKRFRWDSAHRLPKHEGMCRNLHGHSYSMTVELEGPVDDDGMVIDFKVIKGLVKPLVDAWDHATLVSRDDTDLLNAVRGLDSKYVTLPFESTAENLAMAVLDHILSGGSELLRTRGIRQVRVRVEETESSFAAVTRAIEG